MPTCAQERWFSSAVKVSKELAKAIDEFAAGDPEAAMAHACMAVDGSARAAYPHKGVHARFTAFLRAHAQVLERMGLSGLDVVESRFAPASAGKGTGPWDAADLIYFVHRCAHGHGDEVPFGWELVPNESAQFWLIELRIDEKTVRLPESVVWGLLATVVLAETNRNQQSIDPIYLLYWDPPGTSGEDRLEMPINEWWGRESDFLAITLQRPRSFIRMTSDGPIYVTIEEGGGTIEIEALE